MVTRTLSTIRKAFKKGVILSLLFHLEIKRNVCYEGWREVQLRCDGVSDKPNVSSYMLLSLLFGWISQRKLFLGLFYKNEKRKVFLSRYNFSKVIQEGYIVNMKKINQYINKEKASGRGKIISCHYI